MTDTSLFTDFLANLAISNVSDISTRYRNITQRLNRDFWGSESESAHSWQIGSYGRRTAIDGVSDLDMVFEIQKEDYDRYRSSKGNGPSIMLQEVRSSLLKRYPSSDVRADGQVVGVKLGGYRIEVLPAFPDADGNFIHGDTNNGGRWKTTRPRPEMAAVHAMNAETGGCLQDVCRMLRAWKNQVGVGIGGLLIDTLAYNFFEAHPEHHDAAVSDYPALLVTLFTWLAGLPEQDYWLAPGSRDRVKCKSKFQGKAQKAARRCQEAVDAEGDEARSAVWRKVFGKPFPKVEAVRKAALPGVDDREEFIEDQVPVDIRHDITLECEIKAENILESLLSAKRRNRQRVPKGRHLRFFVAASTIPGPYTVKWKVRNRGPEAERLNMLRGQIEDDKGNTRQRLETADFDGDHYVEVYALQDGVCVARDRIPVPI